MCKVQAQVTEASGKEKSICLAAGVVAGLERKIHTEITSILKSGYCVTCIKMKPLNYFYLSWF